MSGKEGTQGLDARVLLKAALAWLLTAALLLLAFSLAASRLAVSSRSMAYLSAALSFFTAFAAGAAAAGRRSGGRLLLGLLTGAALCLILLGVGLLVSRGELNADGMISAVSFTLAGALCGSVLPGGKSGLRQRRRAFSPGRRSPGKTRRL